MRPWFRVALHALLAFPVGAAVGYPLAVAVALGLGALFQVSQREGAFAMGVFFVIGPAGSMMLGAVAAVWAGARAWRKAPPALPPLSAGQRTSIAAALAGVAGYAAGLAIRDAAGLSILSHGPVVMLERLPPVLAAFAALIAGAVYGRRQGVW